MGTRKEANVVRANDGTFILSSSDDKGTLEISTAATFSNLIQGLSEIFIPQVTHAVPETTQ